MRSILPTYTFFFQNKLAVMWWSVSVTLQSFDSQTGWVQRAAVFSRANQEEAMRYCTSFFCHEIPFCSTSFGYTQGRATRGTSLCDKQWRQKKALLREDSRLSCGSEHNSDIYIHKPVSHIVPRHLNCCDFFSDEPSGSKWHWNNFT